MEHSELVRLAAEWLQRRGCCVVITEMAAGNEQADAIGWLSNGESIMVECKASLADFEQDAKKPFRRRPKLGIGRKRLFCAPAGLISPKRLPKRWGLLEAKGNKVGCKVHAKGFSSYSRRQELVLLLSALRRIGQSAPQGISVRSYVFQTRNRATLGTAQ